MSDSAITWNRSAKRKLTPRRGAASNPRKLVVAPAMSAATFRETYDHSILDDVATRSWSDEATRIHAQGSASRRSDPLDAAFEAMYLLYGQCPDDDWGAYGEALCGTQGVTFALDVLGQMPRVRAAIFANASSHKPLRFLHEPALRVVQALRRQLAAVAQSDHDEASARAEELWEEHAEDLMARLRLAYMFPERADWGDAIARAWPARFTEASEQLPRYSASSGLVYGTGASKESLLELNVRLFAAKDLAVYRPRDGCNMTPGEPEWRSVLDMADRLGEEALEVLTDLYGRAWTAHPTPIAEALALFVRAETAQAFASEYARWISHGTRPKRWSVDTKFMHDHPNLSLAPVEATLAGMGRGKARLKTLLRDIKAQVDGAVKEKTKASKYITRDTLPPGLADPIWRDKSRKRERKKYDPTAFADLTQLPHDAGDTDPDLSALHAKDLGYVATRAMSLRWARAFPRAAAVGAIPRLLGSEDARERGGFIELLRVAHVEDPAAVEAVIEAYGEEVAAALPTLDPYQFCPARMPKLPHFWTPELWTPIRLKSDPSKLLPSEIHEDIGFMLKFSGSGTPYLGLLELGEVADATSLADFAWDLFESWLKADAPGKDSWIIQAIALYGGAKMADELPHYIDRWCYDTKYARAAKVVAALENGDNPYVIEMFWRLLQTTSHDKTRGALGHVQRITGLARGIDEIADIKAPTFGLGPSRQLELEPGSDLEVWLDADLEPHLRTSNQSRVRLSPTARLRWKRLKTQCARENQFQAMRFERAMKLQRRWSFADWRESVLTQPLLGLLAQRLVWGIYDADDELVQTWRVDESNEIIDIEDEPFAALDDATVGIVHPLELGEEELREWTLVLGDYEIIQPFAQITRAVYTPTGEEITEAFEAFRYHHVPLGVLYRMCEVGGWTRRYDDAYRSSQNAVYYIPRLEKTAPTNTREVVTYLGFWPGFGTGKKPRLEMKVKTQIYRGDANMNRVGGWEHATDISRAEIWRDLEELRANIL